MAHLKEMMLISLLCLVSASNGFLLNTTNEEFSVFFVGNQTDLAPYLNNGTEIEGFKQVKRKPKYQKASMERLHSTLGICQLYTGSTCAQYLANQTVFVAPEISIDILEERLRNAYLVIRESKDMNPNCRGYALPSLCFSVLPICQTPELTNHQYFAKKAAYEATLYQKPQRKKAKKNQKFQLSSSTSATEIPDTPVISISERRRRRQIDLKKQRKFYQETPPPFEKYSPPTRNSEDLQRICRSDCELLELELCQKDYAIAKRHPTIGQKLPLEECEELPDYVACSHIPSLQIDLQPMDNCYWDHGIDYRGTLNRTQSGKECMRWAKVMRDVSDTPELAGHNYCRNPKGKEKLPWCYVDRSKTVEYCFIPRCVEKMWFLVISGTLVAAISVSMVVAICCCRKCKRKGISNIQSITLPNADKNIYGNSRVSSPVEMASLLPSTESQAAGRSRGAASVLRVPQYRLEDVKFVEELGEGAFGKVYKGELTLKSGEKIFVAVKALKENANSKTQADFKREIELISDLRHDNIVCLFGVVLKQEPLCMLFEYMSAGDLHEYLIAHSPNEGKSLTQVQFLYISLQICNGMEYLSSHHYVHRDLAARNCLVGENLTVKISDFGLSRDIYSSDYYRVQSKSLLPVRWMPSESILYGKFTTESDVWSFGVVLWEIYSYGLQPYYGHSNQEVINMIRSRQLLPCPEYCPSTVYGLMIECWHEQAVRRPTFGEIGHRLKVWHGAAKRAEQVDQTSFSRTESRASVASRGERRPPTVRKSSVEQGSEMAPPIDPKYHYSLDRKELYAQSGIDQGLRSSINRSSKSINAMELSRKSTENIDDPPKRPPRHHHHGSRRTSQQEDAISTNSGQWMGGRRTEHRYSSNNLNRTPGGSVTSIISDTSGGMFGTNGSRKGQNLGQNSLQRQQ